MYPTASPCKPLSQSSNETAIQRFATYSQKHLGPGAADSEEDIALVSLALDVSSLLPSLQESLQSVQHLEARAAASEADAAATGTAHNACDGQPGPSQQTPEQSLETRQASCQFVFA